MDQEVYIKEIRPKLYETQIFTIENVFYTIFLVLNRPEEGLLKFLEKFKNSKLLKMNNFFHT